MSEAKAKALYEASEKIGAEMRAMMDALEKVHGTELVVLAHHYAGIMRSTDTIGKRTTGAENDIAILNIQVNLFFQFLCQQLNVQFAKMIEISLGVRDAIARQQADLNEAVNGISLGDKNGTAPTTGN